MRQKFLTHPAFSPTFYQLFDGREVTRVALTAVEIGLLATDAVFSPRSRRAFVAPTRETLDLARTYQVFRSINAGREEMRIFRTMEDAERWLEE